MVSTAWRVRNKNYLRVFYSFIINMRQLNNISDPVYIETPLNAPGRFILKFIRDKRDIPFVFLSIQIICTLIPLIIALYLVNGAAWWMLAALFTVLEIYFIGPFILMLHNTSHNTLFKNEYKWGNRLIPWGLCPFMGQSPDTYLSHHIGMHHAENNMELDKSSTLRYQRDSLADFMKYFGRFLFLGITDLAAYLRLKQKGKFLRRALIGEAVFLLVCLALAFVSWQTTLLVFVAPLLIVRFMMMAGNWAQHAFVDPQAPQNNFLNSITCINSIYNKRCWNDGYHIGHHLKPHMHWTDMPRDFMANKDKYAENKALVFEKLDYHQIWAMLMFKRYDRLASYLVNINGMFSSREEAIRLMKQRTKRIDLR